jgi:hypothetical protein
MTRIAKPIPMGNKLPQSASEAEKQQMAKHSPSHNFHAISRIALIGSRNAIQI